MPIPINFSNHIHQVRSDSVCLTSFYRQFSLSLVLFRFGYFHRDRCYVNVVFLLSISGTLLRFLYRFDFALILYRFYCHFHLIIYCENISLLVFRNHFKFPISNTNQRGYEMIPFFICTSVSGNLTTPTMGWKWFGKQII